MAKLQLITIFVPLVVAMILARGSATVSAVTLENPEGTASDNETAPASQTGSIDGETPGNNGTTIPATSTNTGLEDPPKTEQPSDQTTEKGDETNLENEAQNDTEPGKTEGTALATGTSTASPASTEHDETADKNDESSPSSKTADQQEPSEKPTEPVPVSEMPNVKQNGTNNGTTTKKSDSSSAIQQLPMAAVTLVLLSLVLYL